MNERIKQLADHARSYALDEKRHFEYIHHTEQCMEEYREVYNTKFAELLVLECADLFDDEPESKTRYSGIACRGMIKSYFGVE